MVEQPSRAHQLALQNLGIVAAIEEVHYVPSTEESALAKLERLVENQAPAREILELVRGLDPLDVEAIESAHTMLRRAICDGDIAIDQDGLLLEAAAAPIVLAWT